MGSKKKKMDLMTSLSRRETTISVPENGNCGGVNKSIGCMAGIFHFLSRHHHNNSRKRLPSAGRKKKTITSQPKESPPASMLKNGEEQPMQVASTTTHAIIPEKTFYVKEIQRQQSCEVQRSPTLPSELRRSSSAELAVDSPRRPTPLVVRLMGLDDVPVTSPASAAEKRRKLLGALEKCDEDLKSLKRIIDAVSVADKRRKTVGAVEAVAADSKTEHEDGDESVETVKSVDSVGEQPSPVSVLEAVSSPTCRSKRSKIGELNKNNLNNKQNSPSIFNKITMERLPLEEFGRAKRTTDDGGRRRQFESKRSHALVESVGEVWEDGVWEQRWEFGRVAVGLERGILRDLVDEFVREMLGWYLKGLVLQGISCRKRLCF